MEYIINKETALRKLHNEGGIAAAYFAPRLVVEMIETGLVQYVKVEDDPYRALAITHAGRMTLAEREPDEES